MNILVIGNGFDLAHGLPTKYGDFLEFVKVIYQIIDEKVPNDNIYYGGLVQEIKTLVQEKVDTMNVGMWKDLIYENLWIKYFWNNFLYKKENWIDFECEISNVIQGIDNDMHGLTKVYELKDTIENISNDFLNKWCYDSKKTFKELRDRLLNDLNKLTRALELYLCEFVEKIKCIKVVPDIRDLYFDKILSFNYTDTYKKIYDPDELSEYDYIHGKDNLDYSEGMSNLVLGIDEYLSEERKNKDVDFIAFKKFFQRIYKRTGNKYKEWVDDIRSNEPIRNLKAAYKDKLGSKVYDRENAEYHNLYIFGHSLDVTDKDVFRDLILNENVLTTIFYYNKDDFGTKITNLVKVIGQDELIRRSGGRKRTIEYRSCRVW